MSTTRASGAGICARCPALLARVSYCSRCGPPNDDGNAATTRSTLDLCLRPVSRPRLSPAMRQVVRWRSVAVVTPLLMVLVVSGGLGARMLWAEIPQSGSTQDASATSSGLESESLAPATAGGPTIVACWDGTRARARDCTVPSGRPGVRWVFPALAPRVDECRDLTGRDLGSGRLVEWECDKDIDGRPLLVTFAELTSVREGRATFAAEYSDVRREEIEDRRVLWMRAKESGDYRYRGAVMYQDYPFAVSVRATTEADADQALREGVTFRPSERVRVRSTR